MLAQGVPDQTQDSTNSFNANPSIMNGLVLIFDGGIQIIQSVIYLLEHNTPDIAGESFTSFQLITHEIGPRMTCSHGIGCFALQVNLVLAETGDMTCRRDRRVPCALRS